MRHWVLAIGLAATLVAAGCHHEDNKSDPLLTSNPKDPGDFSFDRTFPLKDLAQSEVKVAGQSIPVWVMDTQEKQNEGFMFLREKDVPDGHGMIFVMADTTTQSFYMKNCLMELDIAFIGPDMKVLNVVHGKRVDESPLPSKGPAKYVLEFKPGEAAKFGVKAGVKVDIPSDLTYKR